MPVNVPVGGTVEDDVGVTSLRYRVNKDGAGYGPYTNIPIPTPPDKDWHFWLEGLTAGSFAVEVEAGDGTTVTTALRNFTVSAGVALPASFFAEYKLDEGAGTTVNDSIGTQHYSFAASGPTWTVQGLNFAAASSQFLEMATQFTEIQSNAPWSFCALLRTTDIEAAGKPDRTLFSQSHSSTNRNQVIFRNNRLNIGTTDTSPQACDWTNADNVWVAVGASHDGVGGVRMWLNTFIQPLFVGATYISGTLHNQIGLNTSTMYYDGDLGWFAFSTEHLTDTQWQNEVYPYIEAVAEGKGITL